MVPFPLAKVVMTLLIGYALLSTPVAAQRNVFHFKTPPQFEQASTHAWVYHIPADSVYSLVFDGRPIHPNTAWMQQQAWIIPRNGLDSLMKSAQVAAGYYMAVSASGNRISLNFARRKSFRVNIERLEQVSILSVVDTNDQPVRDAIIVKGKQRILFNAVMNGYVLKDYKNNELVTIRHGEDISFTTCTVRANEDFEKPKPRNEVYDYNRESRTYNGYLVTNMPKYKPGDTVKWKAYLLNPQADNLPVKELLRVSFSNGSYGAKTFMVSPAYKAAEPGVYFGEFVLGDSVKTDQSYTLSLYGTRTAFRLSARFDLEDYLLSETNLRITTDGAALYQPGDSVNLYAYAFNSNNLPLLDGMITVNVLPGHYNKRSGQRDFIPDTLYTAKVAVSADGETNIGFPTGNFPGILHDFEVRIRLENSNFESRDTVLTLRYSNAAAYIQVKQTGNKLLAELIRNKKPIAGTGAIRVHRTNSIAAEQKITFPYEHTIDGSEVRFYILQKDSAGNTLSTYAHEVADTYLDEVSDFEGDTAVLQLYNPGKVLFRYSIYRGNRYQGYGVAHGDTVLRMVSKKGRTITLIGTYTWRGISRSKRFEVFKRDRQLNIDLNRKELIYPGQQDSISILLSNKDGKKIGRTNVTVLAFNSQFQEDYTADVPYGGLLYPAYQAKKIRSIDELYMRQPGQQLANRQWLSRCGADTQFFYKQLYLLPDDVAWVNYDIPGSVMPQLGIYLFRQGNYYQPEIIYVDGNPVYFRQASSTNPSCFFIREGVHTIRFRMAQEEYYMEHVYACQGMKTDLYLNIDSVGPLYRYDKVGDSVITYRRDHLRSLVTKVKRPDTLLLYEQYALASSLLMYRDEVTGKWFDDNDVYGSPLFQQYPYQYVKSQNRYYGSGSERLMLIGPFNFKDSIGFFQKFNTKLKFIPERNYIFSFRPQMTRVEKWPADKLLQIRLADQPQWPYSSYVTGNPDSFDSLVVMPPLEKMIYSSKKGILASERIRYRLLPDGKLDKADGLMGGAGIIALEDSIIQHVIYRKKNSRDSVLVQDQCFDCDLRMTPGSYEVMVIWNDDCVSVYDSVMIRGGGKILIPVSYKAANERFDYRKVPRWLASRLRSDTLDETSWILYNITKTMKRGTSAGRHGYAYGNSTGIQGTLTDEKGEPLPSAAVIVTQGTVQKGGTITNFDGEYSLRDLEAGRYDVAFRWQNFQQTITGVIVNTDAVSMVNNKLNTMVQLTGNGIVIRAARRHVPPLIDAKRPGGRSTRTSEMLEKLPTTNISDAASLSTRAYQSRNGFGLGGSRSSGTQYVIDGMVVSGGNQGMVQQAYGGVPARYGDDEGGLYGKSGHYLSSEKSKSFISGFMSNMMGASGMRKHFRDWAIWEPNLWTDDQGHTSFNVVYPDNMTSWKTYVLAMNRNGFAGRVVHLTRSFKPLSAQLSAPRFLRYGDTAEVIGKVANYTQQPFLLNYSFGVSDRITLKDTLQVRNTKVVAYKIAAPATNTVDTISLPLSFRIAAENGYQDGEEHKIPVMPVGTTETRGQFVPMVRDTVISCMPDTSAGHFTGKARVFVDGSMLEVMLRETEMLKAYPHGCNEQLTTKLLAIYYEETIKKMLGSTDFNNTVAKRKILDQLVKAQRNDGGFGWWSNNNADYRITNYIISTLQKINDNGWLDFIIRRGLEYLNAHVDQMNVQDQLATLNTLSEGKYPANFKPLLDKINVTKESVYNRLAMVKIRKEQGLPYRQELDTLVTMRHESRIGIRWGAASYDWYRDDLAATLLAYALIKEDSVYSKLKPRILNGLLFERKNGAYRNTASSGLVLTTLLPDLLQQRSLAGRRQPTYVRISGSLQDSVTQFPKAYDLTDSKPQLVFEKKGINPVYVSVVYSYFNTKPQRRDSDFVVLTYFLNAQQDTVTALKAGERITIRTIVNCKKDAEYVMIEVPVPAGCVQAGNKNAYYHYPEASRENFKDQTYIFCNRLNKGSYSFDVVLEARYKGSYNLSPARAGMMYYPEEYGNTEVKQVQVK